MSLKKITALSAIATLLLFSACDHRSTLPGKAGARAEVAPLGGGKARGSVSFTREGDDVLVEAHFTGLTPGDHGFHIHEHGDCGGVAAAAAGGHFDPKGEPHGMPGMVESHQGDLGNLHADVYGYAYDSFRSHSLKLAGTEGITGLSVVVHQDPDDFSTQPSGASGARIACGLIVAVER